MKLIFLLYFIVNICIAIGNECEWQDTITYVDEITILKKIFNQLKDVKNEIGQCNSRFAESQKHNDFTLNDSSIFDIRFDDVPEKCKTRNLPKNCAEATACTQRSGIYKIHLEKYNSEAFLVECDVKTEGGGWILIQRRLDGSENFYRNWLEYQQGFGHVEGEFFIGLDKLHALTNYNGPQELLIVLDDNGEIRQAKYNNFVVGDESEMYVLKHLGAYSGNAGDSLLSHLGMKFSTKDRDNDNYEGAWWYNKCHVSNLNGKYGDTSYAKGITWMSFRGYNVSIKHVTMMIRRRTF